MSNTVTVKQEMHKRNPCCNSILKSGLAAEGGPYLWSRLEAVTHPFNACVDVGARELKGLLERPDIGCSQRDHRLACPLNVTIDEASKG